MNAARYFMRREDYQTRQTPRESPFRKFDVKCLNCGLYQLRLVAQMVEKAVEMALLLVCNKCRQREILPVKRPALHRAGAD